MDPHATAVRAFTSVFMTGYLRVMRPQMVLWHITRHIMGIPEPKNGAGLIPFILSLLFGVAVIIAGYYRSDMHLITVLKNAGLLH